MRRRPRLAATAWFLAPALVWFAALYVFPLAQLASVSLQSPYPGWPGYYYRDVNVGTYVHAATQFAPHLLRSAVFASCATLLAFTLALPVAYVLAFRASRHRGLIWAAVLGPYAVPFLLRTLAWRQVLADDAPAARVLAAVGLTDGRLTQTAAAVVAGLAYNYFPFMLIPLASALRRVDRSVIEASRDLFGGPWATLWRVILPLASPGIAAGSLLTFLPAAGDYVTAELLGSRADTMAGNAIEGQMLRVVGGYPLASATSMILLATMALLVTAYLRRFGAFELVRGQGAADSPEGP